ncbi:Protein Dicer [Diplonema papillatum]|nr:Protein Dicer [Diplonema papillatum]
MDASPGQLQHTANASPRGSVAGRLRSFQQELFHDARDKNVVIYAPTGSGKTWVSAAVAQAVLQREPKERYVPTNREISFTPHKKNFVVFLVKRIPLVEQQAEMFRSIFLASGERVRIEKFSSEHRTRSNHSGSWGDDWNRTDIVFMIGQIFLDLLDRRIAFITDADLIIVDECHHTVGQSDLNRVFKTHYHDFCKAHNVPVHQRPQILGLTASPGTDSTFPETYKKTAMLLENLNSDITYVRNPENVALLEQTVKHAHEQVEQYESNAIEVASTVLVNDVMEKLEELVVRKAESLQRYAERENTKKRRKKKGYSVDRFPPCTVLGMKYRQTIDYRNHCAQQNTQAQVHNVIGVQILFTALEFLSELQVHLIEIGFHDAERHFKKQVHDFTTHIHSRKQDTVIPKSYPDDHPNSTDEVFEKEVYRWFDYLFRSFDKQAEEWPIDAERCTKLMLLFRCLKESYVNHELHGEWVLPGVSLGSLQGINGNPWGCDFLLRFTPKGARHIEIVSVVTDRFPMEFPWGKVDTVVRLVISEDAQGEDVVVLSPCFNRESGESMSALALVSARVSCRDREDAMHAIVEVHDMQLPADVRERAGPVARGEVLLWRLAAPPPASAPPVHGPRSRVSQESGKFRGMIFTQTKCGVSRIVDLITRTPWFRGRVKPIKFVGHQKSGGEKGMNNKEQADVITRFKTGAFNLMVATNVAEEGIDIPVCNFVARYDAQFSVTSLIQSRGRARARNSIFVVVAGGGEIDRYKCLREQEAWQQSAVEQLAASGGIFLKSTDAPAEDGAAVAPDALIERFWERQPLHFLGNYAPVFEKESILHGFNLTLRCSVGGEVVAKSTPMRGSSDKEEARTKTGLARDLCAELHRRGLLSPGDSNRHVQPVLTTKVSNAIRIVSATTALQPGEEVVESYHAGDWEETTPSEFLMKRMKTSRSMGARVLLTPSRMLQAVVEIDGAKTFGPLEVPEAANDDLHAQRQRLTEDLCLKVLRLKFSVSVIRSRVPAADPLDPYSQPENPPAGQELPAYGGNPPQPGLPPYAVAADGRTLAAGQQPYPYGAPPPPLPGPYQIPDGAAPPFAAYGHGPAVGGHNAAPPYPGQAPAAFAPHPSAPVGGFAAAANQYVSNGAAHPYSDIHTSAPTAPAPSNQSVTNGAGLPYSDIRASASTAPTPSNLPGSNGVALLYSDVIHLRPPDHAHANGSAAYSASGPVASYNAEPADTGGDVSHSPSISGGGLQQHGRPQHSYPAPVPGARPPQTQSHVSGASGHVEFASAFSVRDDAARYAANRGFSSHAQQPQFAQPTDDSARPVPPEAAAPVAGSAHPALAHMHRVSHPPHPVSGPYDAVVRYARPQDAPRQVDGFAREDASHVSVHPPSANYGLPRPQEASRQVDGFAREDPSHVSVHPPSANYGADAGYHGLLRPQESLSRVNESVHPTHQSEAPPSQYPMHPTSGTSGAVSHGSQPMAAAPHGIGSALSMHAPSYGRGVSPSHNAVHRASDTQEASRQVDGFAREAASHVSVHPPSANYGADAGYHGLPRPQESRSQVNESLHTTHQSEAPHPMHPTSGSNGAVSHGSQPQAVAPHGNGSAQSMHAPSYGRGVSPSHNTVHRASDTQEAPRPVTSSVNSAHVPPARQSEIPLSHNPVNVQSTSATGADSRYDDPPRPHEAAHQVTSGVASAHNPPAHQSEVPPSHNLVHPTASTNGADPRFYAPPQPQEAPRQVTSSVNSAHVPPTRQSEVPLSHKPVHVQSTSATNGADSRYDNPPRPHEAAHQVTSGVTSAHNPPAYQREVPLSHNPVHPTADTNGADPRYYPTRPQEFAHQATSGVNSAHVPPSRQSEAPPFSHNPVYPTSVTNGADTRYTHVPPARQHEIPLSHSPVYPTSVTNGADKRFYDPPRPQEAAHQVTSTVNSAHVPPTHQSTHRSDMPPFSHNCGHPTPEPAGADVQYYVSQRPQEPRQVNSGVHSAYAPPTPRKEAPATHTDVSYYGHPQETSDHVSDKVRSTRVPQSEATAHHPDVRYYDPRQLQDTRGEYSARAPPAQQSNASPTLNPAHSAPDKRYTDMRYQPQDTRNGHSTQAPPTQQGNVPSNLNPTQPASDVRHADVRCQPHDNRGEHSTQAPPTQSNAPPPLNPAHSAADVRYTDMRYQQQGTRNEHSTQIPPTQPQSHVHPTSDARSDVIYYDPRQVQDTLSEYSTHAQPGQQSNVPPHNPVHPMRDTHNADVGYYAPPRPQEASSQVNSWAHSAPAH